MRCGAINMMKIGGLLTILIVGGILGGLVLHERRQSAVTHQV